MLGAGPLRHVGADLADYLQGRVRVHAVDPGQVHSRHPVKVRPYVEAGRVALTESPAVGRQRPTITAVLKPPQLGFNLPVALGNLTLIEPVQLQGLGQLEDVLLPPVPPQRPGDGRLVGLDLSVAQSP